MDEKYLEKQLFQRIRACGGHALKFTSSSEIGYPDRLVLLPGARAVWVELKSPGQKPRKIQMIRHEELKKFGFDVYVIDSIDKLNKLCDDILRRTRR